MIVPGVCPDGRALERPRLLASTVLVATDTRRPHSGGLNEARSGEPPTGQPGQVVAIIGRPGRDPLTLRHDPWALEREARAAGLDPLWDVVVVGLIGSDGQMRDVPAG